MNSFVLLSLGSIAIFHSQAILAQQCDVSKKSLTPSARFIDMQDGTVRDRVTGLLWQRCVVGQTWDGKTCLEAPRDQVKSWFSWHDAKAQVRNMQTTPELAGWRLPRLIELSSIVDSRCCERCHSVLHPGSPIKWW